MPQTVLAALRPATDQTWLIPAITALAHRHQLEIYGVSVLDAGQLAPPEPVPLGGERFKVECDRIALEGGRELAAKMVQQLADAAVERNLKCAASLVSGTIADVLTIEAQAVDFLACGAKRQPSAAERTLLQTILQFSPRPVLVLPEEGVESEGVLIAYDGSRQSARALSSFVASGLWKGRTIHLVTIDNGDLKLSSSVKAAAAYLHHHGISSELHVRMPSKDAGADLLQEIDRLGVGMVVMGAFSKSTFHEFFLGSVTRTLLTKLPVPIFLDH
ncbi:universal stress protein [Planctomicrobium sp. SH661]|uniref:universal stress protein n=1 Tax=Planctomicrobium sp. SH661 TaxID=3448124 RepID=UPI003F5BEA83